MDEIPRCQQTRDGFQCELTPDHDVPHLAFVEHVNEPLKWITEPFEQALTGLLQQLGSRIEDERRQSQSYQELLAQDGLIRMLRFADHAMMKVALDVGAVLKDKYDITLDRPTWRKIIGLAAWADDLGDEYANDGQGGSVDRAWQHVARELRAQGRTEP